MEWDNRTPYPAMLLTTVIDENRMAGAVVARITYRLQGGHLTPAEEQPWLVSIEPWTSPLGPFEADQPFRKGGVDLFVVGSACTPAREPQRRLEVSIEVGSFRTSAIAFGKRVWQKRAGRGLLASEPEPFVTLPLSQEHAFGGKVVVDGLVSAHADNPQGVGLYVDESSAEGQPLPRIEDPLAPIRAWSDRPEPVLFGVCPLHSGQRLRSALEIGGGKLERVNSRLFNMAYPRMVAPRVLPGDELVLTHFAHDGPIAFQIPAPCLSARVTLGDKRVDRDLTIEEIGVEVAESRVFIGYRFPFRYGFVPHQRRLCTLELKED
jgi:hypothetical protein